MSQNQTRKPSFDIHPLILNRWSARSMTGEELDDNIIMSLFEASKMGTIFI